MIRKVITASLVFFAVFISLAFAVQPTFATDHETESPPTWESTIPPFNKGYYQQNKADYEAAIEDCSTPSLECLIHYTTQYTAIEWIDNILGIPDDESAGVGDRAMGSGGVKVVKKGNFVDGIAFLIGSMFATPAAGTGPYIADVMESARIVPPAYAQGLGFAALNPVLELWKVFRNLSYMFFILIFLVIGFMIMFRHKIGGQTAVTAQQAIPSVIISLLFVTFSYAIVGFMIDMMYVSMYLILGIFETSQFFKDGADIINFNIIQLAGVLFTGGGDDLFLYGETSNIVSTFVGNLGAGETWQNIAGFIGGLSLSLVIAVAILIGVFRLFFELLRAYATTVLLTVTAPLLLMMGAIPGNNAFGKWIKQVAGNLLPFPTVLLVLVMYYYFTKGGASADGGFMPPFLLSTTSGQANVLSAVMGFAILLALPEIVKHVRETVAGKGGFGEFIAQKGGEAFKRGWEGGELVPGLGWTNTAKVPVVGGIAGSGKDAAKSAGVVGAWLGGGIYGAGEGAYRRKYMGEQTTPYEQLMARSSQAARGFAKRTKHQLIGEKKQPNSGGGGGGGTP
jgi:hypothetical protein